MITLTNVNLKFSKTLIENGQICIPDNSITVITGKSGSGKTSLLYLIGLISSNSDYDYIFNENRINLNSDKEVSWLRKSKIGYVFQDNTLIDSLSVNENIRYAAKIAGVPITDEDISAYLRQVKLDIDGKKYPRTLSGGEQQRLAIACAMAKKPDLIIADEPTSALDAENSTMIMDIFKDFAKQVQKMVVIASHNPIVCNYADVLYEIYDYKINLIHGNEYNRALETGNFIPNHKTLCFSFYIQYALKTMRRARFLKTLMLFLCALSIAFAASIRGIGDGLIKHQQNLMKDISDRQIFLVNLTAPLQTIIDVDENLSISSNELDEIKSISNIDMLYPYYEFKSSGYDINKGDSYNSCNINVTDDNETRQYLFDTYANNGYNNIAILPYYKEDNLQKRLFKTFSTGDESAIYLSYQLANMLALNSSNETNAKLQLAIGVPVYTTDVELHVSNVQSTYAADIDLSVITSMDLEISGVLSSDYTNKNSASGNNVIYMPIDMMNNIMASATSGFNKAVVNESIKLNEWRPSAYVVFVKDYNDVKITIEKLESVGSNFKAISGYQNIESMNEMLVSVRSTATWIIVIVLAIILILMAVIYINHTVSRKYEVAILKSNGLNRNEVFKLVLAESLLQVLIISMLATLFSVLIANVVSLLFNFQVVKFSLSIIITIALIAIFSVIAPTTGSIIIMNRVKPDKVMRN